MPEEHQRATLDDLSVTMNGAPFGSDTEMDPETPSVDITLDPWDAVSRFSEDIERD